MPNVLNGDGLVTATQAELLANLTESFQTIYGVNIDLSSNTPDGQLLNIIIQVVLDLQDLLKQEYNSFDPDNAIGTQLDQRCAINGIQRQGGTFSTTNITIVLVQSAVYLYGLNQSDQPIYTISDNVGNQWFLETTQSNVGPGTIVCSFRAAEPGASTTIPNTINVPVTIVLGVSSVNNPTTQSVVGLEEETDAALKIRRTESVAISSQGYLQGLLAALKNINGISSVFVYENNTNITDSDGVPGHSIWVIVDGDPTILQVATWSNTKNYQYGDIVFFASINYISLKNNNQNHVVSDTAWWGIYDPVAHTIYVKRNAGCGMFGDISYVITQIDGTFFVVNWDQVVAQNLYIAFTATSIDGVNQPNITGIIAGLVGNYNFEVYEEININQMATIVQNIDQNCLVTNAGLSLSLIQIATLSGIAASGTFKFAYDSMETSAINWDDSVSTIQTKLRLLAGLEDAIVTGSIASQTLTIALNFISASTLITVTNNSLVTSAPVSITFSFNEGYSNTLLPTQKKNKFALNAENIIILPMILSPSTSNVIKLATQQMTGLGGYGILVYSMQANPSGGTINSSTGLYTAGSSTGTDIAKVTDAFGNSATATIVVV